MITLEDGKATRIQGDPQHPVTQGFLCAKVAKYLDRVYSPDRVQYPMKRVAPKGPIPIGEAGRPAFERISWDEALDTIAARLKKIAAEFGMRGHPYPIPAAEPWRCSTALPWTAASFIVWALRSWNAAFVWLRARRV